jgi:hypothetical protein
LKYAFRTVVGLGLELGATVAISLTIYKLLGVVPYGTDEVQADGPLPDPLLP